MADGILLGAPVGTLLLGRLVGFSEGELDGDVLGEVDGT